MKNKLLILVFALIASTMSVFVPSQANASECTAENPCGTWAMLDNDNRVTNIIVCQPSVCGSGTFAGIRVVLQVPANPTTHTSQGGWTSDSQRTVTYNDQNSQFSVSSNTTTQPITKTEVVDSVTLSATVNSNVSTFDSNSVVNGRVEFTPIVDSATSATISATQGELTETKSFNEPKTREQLQESIQESVILKENLNKFFELLRGWIKN